MKEHDLIVIGAGPGGYVAAIRAAQLGMNVACVEKDSALGGTCLRIGCIPSKAMLESSELYAEAKDQMAEHGVQFSDVTFNLETMLARKDAVVNTLTRGVASLFKKHGITRYHGHGRIEGRGRVRVENIETSGEAEELQARHILIASGSKPADLPGIEWDGSRVGSSTEALTYEAVPDHLIVIGAGYIGLEMGTVWRRLGAQVSILEYLDRILPETDAEVAKEAQKVFKRQGLKFHLQSRVTGVRVDGDTCIVEREGADPLRGDRVLVAAGRIPNTNNLGLESVGVQLDDRGRIAVNEHFETSVPGIYAIGDVIPGPMLAHKAEDEGIACVERIVTGYGHVNYEAIPSIVYTQPEVAAVGRTEEQLQRDGIEYRRGTFPFRANGRARTLGQTDGLIKILADAQTDRILGVHIFGPRAGDLIAEAAVAIEFGASSEDLARSNHAHPTLSEALREAAFAVDNRAIHL